MMQRMVGPRRVSAGALSKEVGVSQPTLSLWLKAAGRVAVVSDDEEPKAKAKRAEDWSPQQKLAAVMEAARLSDTALGEWLRRKGLTEEHLRQWLEALEERAAAVFDPREPRVSAESRRRVQELERELRRKDKALAETAALLVLQGKVQALWAEEDASTRQSSDEPSSQASRKPKKQGRH
jgi:DNA-binding transcriptional MerR regulator